MVKGITTLFYYAAHYIFFGIVVYYGIMFVVTSSTAKAAVVPITLNYVYAAVPACGIFSLIFVTLNLIEELQGRAKRPANKEV